MNLSDLPQFTIDEVHATAGDAEGRLVGRFSHLEGVHDNRGWLYRIDRPSIIGDLAVVPTMAGEPVSFVSPDPELVVELHPGEAYAWIDGFWQAYHITMILAGRWQPRTFVSLPARYFRLGGLTGWQRDDQPLLDGAEGLGVREGGWDHEHCELCNTHIGGPGDPHGFVDPEERWLCARCYDRYAVPRDLAFVAGG